MLDSPSMVAILVTQQEGGGQIFKFVKMAAEEAVGCTVLCQHNTFFHYVYLFNLIIG